MRIFLLPISTRRTLLYAHRLNAATGSQQAKQSLLERIQSKAAKTWAGWEQKQSGWQKTVVSYGNEALKRIPYEEWALKSVPPLSTKRKDDELRGDDKVEVIYPRKLVSPDKVTEVLHALSTEREALHRRRLIWCFVGMPISAPFALVPMYVLLPVPLCVKSILTGGGQYPEYPLLLSRVPCLVTLARPGRRETHPIFTPEQTPDPYSISQTR